MGTFCANQRTQILASPMIKRLLSVNRQSITEKDNILITIEDTGAGVPEEAKTKLFTPLFTTKSKGQGFGLAVVKRLTEALGGTITFESEKEKGTKFTIKLPKEE